MTNEIYGHVIDRDEFEMHVIGFIQEWMNTYMAVLERQKSIVPGKLLRPRSYTQVNKFERWTQDQLPAVIVVSPGITGTPKKTGTNVYRAKFTLGVGIVIALATQEQNRKMIGTYAAAIRKMFLDKPSLGGFAMGTEWVGENFEDLPDDSRRSIAYGSVLFVVEVDGVAVGRTGPPTADPPPIDPLPDPGNWPQVTDVTAGVTIIKEPLV